MFIWNTFKSLKLYFDLKQCYIILLYI
jgi:hypothetical protein